MLNGLVFGRLEAVLSSMTLWNLSTDVFQIPAKPFVGHFLPEPSLGMRFERNSETKMKLNWLVGYKAEVVCVLH